MSIVSEFIHRNRLISLLTFLVAAWILYGLFAHSLVEFIYNGGSFLLVDKIIKLENNKSLDYNIKQVDTFYFFANVLCFCFVFGLSSICKWQLKETFTDLGKELQNIKFYLIENRKIALIWLSFLILFGSLYLYLGLLLTSGYEKFNFFGADHWQAILGWTDPKQSNSHKGSQPLLLLLVVPFGYLLKTLTTSHILSVLALNFLFGAIAVTLASIFFWNLTKRYVETILLTLVFGLSMSQLFFSSLPETYALASSTVIANYVLFLACLKNQRLYLAYWIIVGLLTFGVTITNFAQTLICFTATVLTLKRRNKVSSILEYIGIVVSFAFVLSILQRLFFAKAKFFFLPATFTTELSYINYPVFSIPLVAIQELFKHFFLVNFIAPSPFGGNDYENSTRLLLGFFMRPLDYSVFGYVGLILWVSFFGIGFGKNVFANKKNVFFLAVCFVVVFNMVLHSVFEIKSMFLYTCNFTFPVLLLAVNQSLLQKTYLKIGLTLAIMLLGINNLLLMSQIIST